MSILALYEDWVPYRIGVAFVFAHHAVLGAVAPAATFGHDGNALDLALIHAGFIMGAGVANVALWRANERARAMTTATLRRVRIQYEVTHVLAGAVTLDDAVPHLLCLIAAARLLRRPVLDARGGRPPAAREPDVVRRRAPGPGHAGVRRSAVLECGEGVAGRAWRTGTATTSDVLSADTSERTRDVVALAGQQGAVALPIRRGDEVLGVGWPSTSERSERPDAETVELLSSLSTQLALFIDRVQRADEAARFAAPPAPTR